MALTAPSLTDEMPWKNSEQVKTNNAILSLCDSDRNRKQQKINTAAIISVNSTLNEDSWTTLDFGEIDTSLATKLNDDDVKAVLICIDGINRLKRLRIVGCHGVTGDGLKPLRGSTALEEIDLSLEEVFDGCCIPSRFLLHTETVIPILTHIIDVPGNFTRIIHLPRKFREDPSAIVGQFLTQFADLLHAEGYNCPGCRKYQKASNMTTADKRFIRSGTLCGGYYCINCREIFRRCIRCRQYKKREGDPYCENCMVQCFEYGGLKQSSSREYCHECENWKEYMSMIE